MSLTDKKCLNAKPKDHTCRIYDRDGMYLEVSPAGGKWFRLKYRFAGKEKRLSLGVYTDVSLQSARERRDAARKLVAAGIDPSEARKAKKVASAVQAADAENTFEVVARQWHEKQGEIWSTKHGKDVLSSLVRDVFPFIGARPIKEIEAPEIFDVVRHIEARGVREGTHRTLQRISEVFNFAVAAGICDANRAAGMSSILAPKPRVKHFPAVTEPKAFGELLSTLDGYQGSFIVRCALGLAPLVAVRPGELRRAQWADFDLDGGEWRYQITKTDTPLVVPLSRQAVAILRQLHALTGSGRFVFPSARSVTRPMSDAAVLGALRRMEIPADVATGHGFRASFKTICREVLKQPVEYMDMQLGHCVKDPLGNAYDRTTFLPERARLMQRWADYCDHLKSGAGGEVVEMKRA